MILYIIFAIIFGIVAYDCLEEDKAKGTFIIAIAWPLVLIIALDVVAIEIHARLKKEIYGNSKANDATSSPRE